MRPPKPGACASFADPEKTGLDADVFWQAATFSRILRAYLRTSDDPGFGSIISLGDLNCQCTVLKTVDLEQHILLRDDRHIIQVLCHGADLQTDPFAIELVVDQFPDVESRIQLLKIAANIYRRRRSGGDVGKWTVQAVRHRDALAALDRRIEGWSYREIAVFLYGEQAVQDDWTNPNQTMKNRVIRSAKRGFRLMNGGYRALLA